MASFHDRWLLSAAPSCSLPLALFPFVFFCLSVSHSILLSLPPSLQWGSCSGPVFGQLGTGSCLFGVDINDSFSPRFVQHRHTVFMFDMLQGSGGMDVHSFHISLWTPLRSTWRNVLLTWLSGVRDEPVQLNWATLGIRINNIFDSPKNDASVSVHCAREDWNSGNKETCFLESSEGAKISGTVVQSLLCTIEIPQRFIMSIRLSIAAYSNVQ